MRRWNEIDPHERTVICYISVLTALIVLIALTAIAGYVAYSRPQDTQPKAQFAIQSKSQQNPELKPKTKSQHDAIRIWKGRHKRLLEILEKAVWEWDGDSTNPYFSTTVGHMEFQLRDYGSLKVSCSGCEKDETLSGPLWYNTLEQLHAKLTYERQNELMQIVIDEYHTAHKK